MTEIEVRRLRTGPNAGHTILTDGDEIVLVELHMRQATTSPTRIKAVLGIPFQRGEDDRTIIPLPFAQPMMAGVGEKPTGMTPEFRLEMN